MRSLSIDFKRKSFRRCFTLLLASLLASTLCAQDNTDTDKARQLDSVTVVSNKLSPNVTSTMPMQQLLRSELQALGILNLSDAVKKFAGAEVKDYGGIGGMKTVSVRNLGAHHTAVSYDGITISNTQAGQIDIGRYTLDNAESVSLAVGSDDNLLQSARHLASGAILSITSERHAPEGERMEMKIKGGSFGMVSPSFRLWQPISQHTAVTANASFMRADGNYPFKLVNGIEKTTEKRYNSDIYSWQAEANLFHTWRDNSQLDIKAYWYYSQRGLPGAVILYNKKSDERLWDEDFFTQAVYTKRFNNRWSMKARLKYSHSWNKYEDTDVKYENGKRIDVARQNEYYGSVAAQWKPTEWLSLALAEDLFFNNLRSNISISDNLTDPPYPKRTTSLTALSAQVQVQRLKINGNIVATFASESVKAGSQPADKKRLSPSLSASYRLLNDQSLFLRAMYKSTFRMPTFNDLYYIRMGNTGLKPENAHELNAGITYSGRPVRFLKYVTLTVDAYLNNIDDKIVAFPSTYVWKMSNFGKVKIYGFDITLATEIPIANTAAGEYSMILTAAFTNQKAVDKEEDSPSYNVQLPYTPRQSGNLSALLRTPYVNIGYNLLSQGERWSSVQRIPQYQLKAYWEHSITLSREFRMKHCRLNLQATMHNFTNEQYDIIKYYPMPGRSVTFAATLNL